MSADIKARYGTSNQAITITINSLASSATAGRASTAVDNSSNLFLDALVTVKISFPNLAVANDQAVYVYAYGTSDGGTTYTGAITGTDAAYTMDDPTVLRLIGVIPIPTLNKAYVGGPFSVAAAWGGTLPDHWGIYVRNFAGQTLNATLNSAFYQGVYAQAV
jgi:hypothetical protein